MKSFNISSLNHYTKKRSVISILYIAVFIPIIIGFFYILIFAVNIPHMDQWDTDITLGKNVASGHIDISDLIKLNNNHSRPIIPHTIILLTHEFSQYNYIIEVLVSFFLYISSFMVLWLLVWKLQMSHFFTLAIMIPLSWLYFNLYMIRSLLWGLSLYFTSFLLFTFLSLYLLNESKGFDKYLLFSIMAAICSTFSFSSGIFVLIGGTFYLYSKNGYKNNYPLFFWIFASIVTICLYLFDSSRLGMTTASLYSDNISSLGFYPVQKIIAFIGLVGSNIIHENYYACIIGIVILVLFLFILLLNLNNLFLEKTRVWFALLITFAICGIFLVTLRSAGTFLWIPSLRHYPSTLSLFVAIFILAVFYLYKNFSINNEKSEESMRVVLTSLIAGGIIIITIFGFLFHFMPGINQGQYWYTTQMNTGEAFFHFETSNDEKFVRSHPHPETIRDAGTFFKEERLNLWADENPFYSVDHPIIKKVRFFIAKKFNNSGMHFPLD